VERRVASESNSGMVKSFLKAGKPVLLRSAFED
jgi:hypothetical protein